MPGSQSQSEAILAAVANSRRRRILKLVWDAERSAGEIAAELDVSWPATSQNLRVLRDTGLVDERREGTRRYYRANRRALGSMQSFVRQMWEQDLDRLAELAEEESDVGRPKR
jgi:DNA-binding transcriptional ArsR family regulator